MSNKKYYGERKGLQKDPMNFDLLKRVFLLKFKQMENGLYFQQATGYTCVDKKDLIGIWPQDIDTFIYSQIKLVNIWPIEENINDFDEVKLFTVIEFLYDYVSEPVDKWYHGWDKCGWHCRNFNKENGENLFRDEMNSILNDYDGGYQLSKDGEIQKMPPSGFEEIIEEDIQTTQPDDIDNRTRNAKSKFLKYDASLEDKKDAIRTLADVLEFLKTGNITLPTKDSSNLFQIINKFDIRHHDRMQQGDYDKEIFYDWLFYTFLASINLLLKITQDS